MNFLNNLPFNWFDLVVVGVLIVGIQRGRKRGMSEELMPVIKWLLVLVGASLAYEPVGQVLANSSQVFGNFEAYLTAYCGTALLIAIAFAVITKLMGGKLIGSDVFGRNEYYLGMIAGTVRFSCMLIAVLALMNARLYRGYEVKAAEDYQKKEFGSTFFPTFQNLQAQVFQRSFFGPMIKQDLGFLLIKPTAPEKKEIKRKQIELP
jgi:uncharacterized membrane protein required for colicin V production